MKCSYRPDHGPRQAVDVAVMMKDGKAQAFVRVCATCRDSMKGGSGTRFLGCVPEPEELMKIMQTMEIMES